ncbi:MULTISPECIES: YceD family protein [unclassified Microbacterium]|uniref:YceD family protein n=1 Tax=unclassified Microbacterium TaxID=2609290 RepID=UPI003744CECC
MREFTLDIPAPEKWGEGLVSIAKDEPLEIDIRLESVHEGILATATVDTRYTGVCGRCLTDIEAPVEVEFQELFTYPGEEAADFEVQDDHVDLESHVRDAIVLSLPFQPVCQPDCLGLDPDTGNRLTASTDDSERTPLDSRWAALQQFTPDPDDEAQLRGVENTEKS